MLPIALLTIKIRIELWSFSRPKNIIHFHKEKLEVAVLIFTILTYVYVLLPLNRRNDYYFRR